MPISTHGTYLMHKTASGGAYTKLIDIRTLPSIKKPRDLIAVTTMSDDTHKNIYGLKSGDALEFEANYDLDKLTELEALEEKEEDYAVYFGHDAQGVPDGHDGKWEFKGKLDVSVMQANINEAHKLSVRIVPTTSVKRTAAANV